MEKCIALSVKARNSSIISIPISVTHPCDLFDYNYSYCSRRDYDDITLPKLKMILCSTNEVAILQKM